LGDTKKVISKKIIIYLDEFFKKSKKKHSIKSHYKIKNKTTKKVKEK